MNRQELVKRVAKRCHLGEVETKIVIENAFDVLREAFEDGEGLEARGFGTFKVVTMKPRTGRNIGTGESVFIPERKKVKFTLSSRSSR